MLYYSRIDVSEVTDVNETNTSNECDINHYWFCLDKSFRLQTYVCDGCHDLKMISLIFMILLLWT